MSSLFVKLHRYTLTAHPNADSLSLANPTGTSWQCCVKTESFASGQNKDGYEGLALYIPIDSLLPSSLAAKLGLPNVKEGKPYRIKTIKLRGEVSQGLMVPLTELILLGLIPPQITTLENPKLVALSVSDDGNFEPDIVGKQAFVPWVEGDDLAVILGITKYIEPEPEDKSQRREPSGFIRYTDVENIKNFPSVLKEGEEVIITEKIHGSNFRAGWIATGEQKTMQPIFGYEGLRRIEKDRMRVSWDRAEDWKFNQYEFVVGTRRTALKNPVTRVQVEPFDDGEKRYIYLNNDTFVYNAQKAIEETLEADPELNPGGFDFSYEDQLSRENSNRWTRAAFDCHLEEKLLKYPGYIVFGEVFGPGVQKLTYGQESVSLRLFDVWDGKRYLDYDELEALAVALDLPLAPVLYRGPYSESLLEMRSGKTIVGESVHIREGIVLRPAKERQEYGLGRVLLKSVSEEYLLGNWEG